jgi:hypothetical protein
LQLSFYRARENEKRTSLLAQRNTHQKRFRGVSEKAAMLDQPMTKGIADLLHEQSRVQALLDSARGDVDGNCDTEAELDAVVDARLKIETSKLASLRAEKRRLLQVYTDTAGNAAVLRVRDEELLLTMSQAFNDVDAGRRPAQRQRGASASDGDGDNVDGGSRSGISGSGGGGGGGGGDGGGAGAPNALSRPEAALAQMRERVARTKKGAAPQSFHAQKIWDRALFQSRVREIEVKCDDIQRENEVLLQRVMQR